MSTREIPAITTLREQAESLLKQLKEIDLMYKSDSSYIMSELALIDAVEGLTLLHEHAIMIMREFDEWNEGIANRHDEIPTSYSEKHGGEFVTPESKL